MFSNNELLLLYAAEGPVENLKQVMGNCSGFMLQNALDTAAEYGKVECVKALVSVCSAHGSHALWEACYKGHSQVIEVLVQNGFCADGALGNCMMYQKFDCFIVLAPYSDPGDFGDALVRSFLIKDEDKAEIGRRLLMEYCGSHMMLRALRTDNLEHTKAYEWVHMFAACEQQQRIVQQLRPYSAQRMRSKI